ncbi:hypothetical protein Avbf_03994 [Armadillidium vulgare]|nr:hypothetical protein Avbf_03994 [Armadillidium vulgare]
MEYSLCIHIFQMLGLEIKAYYAGHVLGASMFHIRVGSQSIVYTTYRSKLSPQKCILPYRFIILIIDCITPCNLYVKSHKLHSS